MQLDDQFIFLNEGVQLFRIENDGTLQWSTGGGSSSAVRITNTNASIDIYASTTSHAVKLWPGTSRSNEALMVQDLNSIFKTATGSSSPYEVYLRYSNATTTGQPAIGNIAFEAEDSANVFSSYVAFVTAIDDDTSTSRDGRFQIVVASANGTGARGPGQLTGILIDGRGGNGTRQLGFFGTTPAARPTGVAVTATGIHAALVTLGLITA
jgi:hypothetical protein